MSENNKEKVLIVGAGPMGLAAAYQALKKGYEVELIEADDRAGGMAAHFDFDGLSIERFYHFCCLSDYDTLELLEELGRPDAMKWVATKMGYYLDGRLMRWGQPFALLFAPKIDFITKVRYGFLAFTSTLRSDWERLDKITARDWFTGWLGEKGYQRLWASLLELKFYELSDDVSAAWVWQRIKRIGKSRKSLLEERLGYIEGGTETLVDLLVDAITSKGGQIHLSKRASKFIIRDGAVKGVECADGSTFHANKVISTIPTPHIPDLLADADAEVAEPYKHIKNVGVVCILLKLTKPVTDNFWVNVSDSRMDIPGFVEFSNLRPTGDDHIVYVPYYMPQTNPIYNESDEYFVEKCFGYLSTVNPDLTKGDLKASYVARLRYAQPVCETNFPDMLPAYDTPVAGLQIADTCFYYPEDRGVSESARFAKILVDNIPNS